MLGKGTQCSVSRRVSANGVEPLWVSVIFRIEQDHFEPSFECQLVQKAFEDIFKCNMYFKKVLVALILDVRRNPVIFCESDE